MPSFYAYIIASLPTLNFLSPPAINSQRFLDACVGLASDEELLTLKAILEDKEIASTDYAVLRKWFDFDATLRNELVKLRAARKKQDPAKYIRENPYWDAQVIHTAMAAYKNTSILEAEKILDEERWRFLDELSLGHYFDFESLIIYDLKLKILERWEKISQANKEKLLEGALH